jgi:hypothetical protein
MMALRTCSGQEMARCFDASDDGMHVESDISPFTEVYFMFIFDSPCLVLCLFI